MADWWHHRRCEVADEVFAPRISCPCRACYSARRESLDRRLLMLCDGQTICSSTQVVRLGVEHYLRGDIDGGELYISIISGLVDQNEKLLEDRLAMARLSPFMSQNPVAKGIE